MVVDVEAKRSTKIISRNPYKVANNFTSKKSYILNERGASCPSSILRHRLVRWADAVRRTDTVQVGNQFVYRDFRQITPFWVIFEPFVLRRYYDSCLIRNPHTYTSALDVLNRFCRMLIGHVFVARGSFEVRHYLDMFHPIFL